MSYNKKLVLENNLKAITIALSNAKTTEENILQLKEYKGFGGIKSVLLPPDKPELFTSADKGLIEPIKQLHQVLQEYSKDPNEYERYLLSIKKQRINLLLHPTRNSLIHRLRLKRIFLSNTYWNQVQEPVSFWITFMP